MPFPFPFPFRLLLSPFAFPFRLSPSPAFRKLTRSLSQTAKQQTVRQPDSQSVMAGRGGLSGLAELVESAHRPAPPPVVRPLRRVVTCSTDTHTGIACCADRLSRCTISISISIGVLDCTVFTSLYTLALAI